MTMELQRCPLVRTENGGLLIDFCSGCTTGDDDGDSVLLVSMDLMEKLGAIP